MCEAHLGNASSVLYRLGIPSLVHRPAAWASSDNLVDMQKAHSPRQAKQITISLTISAGASYTNSSFKHTVLKNTCRASIHKLLGLDNTQLFWARALEVVSTFRLRVHQFLNMLNPNEDVTLVDSELVTIPFECMFIDCHLQLPE